jgi:UDP-N-acetylglucosamine pyrophosphorylase
MNSDLPKVLHEICGRALVMHVLDAARKLDPAKIVVVVGHKRELVESAVEGLPGVVTVVQDPPMGTGHAVMQAEYAISSGFSEVLILAGDVPLLRSETLESLILSHAGADLTVLSATAPNPNGYGRVIRDAVGQFQAIIEHKDATDEQLKVKEINSGVYVVSRDALFSALHEVTPNNAKGEYYLTDIVGILLRRGARVQAVLGGEFDELQGINTPEELREAEVALQARQASSG